MTWKMNNQAHTCHITFAWEWQITNWRRTKKYLKKYKI